MSSKFWFGYLIFQLSAVIFHILQKLTGDYSRSCCFGSLYSTRNSKVASPPLSTLTVIQLDPSRWYLSMLPDVVAVGRIRSDPLLSYSGSQQNKLACCRSVRDIRAGQQDQ